jgi:molecular chaperone HtpG
MEETHAVAVTSHKVRNYIPHDNILCILSKLPLKSMKRFECVCKLWANTLIQNSYFMITCNNNLISKSNYYDDTYLVLQHGEGQSGRCYGAYRYEFYLLPGQKFEDRIKIDWPPPFQEDDSGIYVLGTVSINGILCLHQRHKGRLVLWNPIARESKIIPQSPFEYVPPHRHPCYELHGFGYDHVTNDYKVIQFVDSCVIGEAIVEDRSSYETFWEIYSLRSNSWRKLDVNIPNGYFYTLKRRIGVYTNGICHWWARTFGSPDVEECLVSFNFSTELLFTTPMPSYLDVSRSFKLVDRELVLLNESIALIATYKEIATIHISTLGELGVRESWIKLFTITCLPFIEYPIGVGNLNNIVFFKKNGNKIAWIDLNTKMIEELDVKVEKYVFVGKYQKSFLPMGGMKY